MKHLPSGHDYGDQRTRSDIGYGEWQNAILYMFTDDPWWRRALTYIKRKLHLI